MRIGQPAAVHWAACSQAVSSTHAPMSTITPLSSASAMNSVGGTSPRVACCQRRSASAAVTSPVSRSRIGW